MFWACAPGVRQAWRRWLSAPQLDVLKLACEGRAKLLFLFCDILGMKSAPPHSLATADTSAPPCLGWQCRGLCLSATPPKRHTFVSVADMPTMSGRQAGNILLSRPIFCRQNCVRESYPRHTFLRVGRNWYYTFLVCATSPMHAAAQPLSDTTAHHV